MNRIVCRRKERWKIGKIATPQTQTVRDTRPNIAIAHVFIANAIFQFNRISYWRQTTFIFSVLPRTPGTLTVPTGAELDLTFVIFCRGKKIAEAIKILLIPIKGMWEIYTQSRRLTIRRKKCYCCQFILTFFFCLPLVAFGGEYVLGTVFAKAVDLLIIFFFVRCVDGRHSKHFEDKILRAEISQCSGR